MLLAAAAGSCLVRVAPGSFPWMGGYVQFGGLSGLSSHVVLQSMMKPVLLLSLEVVCGNSAIAIYSFCHLVCLAAGPARGRGCL